MERLTEVMAASAVRDGLAAALDARALQDLVWVLGKLHPSYHTHGTVRQLLEQLKDRLAQPGLLAAMTPVGLSMVVYGMGKVGAVYNDPAVRRAVSAAVSAAAARPDCGPQALANMAWGLSRTLPPLPSPAAPAAVVRPAAAPGLWPGATHRAVVAAGPGAPGDTVAGARSGAVSPVDAADAALIRQALAVLAEAACQQLEAFKPREIANMLGAMATLGALADPRVGSLLDAARPYLRHRVRQLGPQDLAELLYAYGSAASQASAGAAGAVGAARAVGKVGSGSRASGVGGQQHSAAEFVELLESRCLAVLPSTPPYQLATMLWGLAHLQGGGHRAVRLPAAVAAALERPRGAPFPILAQEYSEQKQGPWQQQRSDERRYGLDSREQHGRSAAAGLGPSEAVPPGLDLGSREALPACHLARMLWALAELGARVPRAGLEELCRVLGRRITELDPQALLMCSWALAALGCPLHPSLEPLASRLASLLPALAPPQLAMALWSVAKLIHTARGDLPGMASLRLFQDSRGPLLAALPRLGLRHVAMVAWAYSAAGVQPGEGALAALWERSAALMAAQASEAPAAALPAGMGAGAPVHSTGAGLGPLRPSGGGGGGVQRLAESGQALAILGRAMAQFRCRQPRALAAFAVAVMARLASAPSPQLPPPPPSSDSHGRSLDGASASSSSAAADRAGSDDAAASEGVFLSSVVCSLGRLGVRDDRLLQLVCRRAVALAPAMGVREAVPLLWGLGAMCQPSPANGGLGGSGGPGVAAGSEARACPPAVVWALAGVVEDAIRSDAIAEAQAVTVLVSRPRDNAAGATAATIAGDPLTRGSALDGGLLSMFLLACVAHRHRPAAPVLQATCALLLRRLPALASHTLCELAWAVATLVPPPGGDVGAHVVLPVPATPPAAAAAAAAMLASNENALEGRGLDVAEAGATGSAVGTGAGADSPAVDALWAAEVLFRLPQRLRALRTGAAGAAAVDTSGAHPAAAVASVLAAPASMPPTLRPSSTPPRKQAAAAAASTAAPARPAVPGVAPVKAAVAAPPPPPAALVAPIYPPRAAQPPEAAASHRLLARALGLLSRRLCAERSELLTLESLVKVTWAMCVARMYTPRLFRYCAARAVCCSTHRLEARPALLRSLIEARAMLARQRPSTWRRLRLHGRWRRAVVGRDREEAARWRLAAGQLLAVQPPGMVRQLQRCQAALEAAAEAADLPFYWRTTFEGERLGVVRLGRRVGYTLVLLPPWQMPATERGACDLAAAVPPPLAGGAVTVRLLRLRGWLVAGLHVERWLGLGQRQQREQLVALHASMREAARRRAQAAAGGAAAAEGPETPAAGAEAPELALAD
ncbi:hypothetical protein GPECTOR_4g841 [Gonium pectorale]|uniref:RAP domain-containing protein n=1 Tax=Gonium pectorale TaxID=33097 RepID=A0A150GY64_GONPE|nr:hypothetical protein GPECTOR_4g841 [Gonium pectorale]|eukprot:KXZ54771.1 hypothetical protein GPECTOR_4g841 [Gonium pectorale]